jgi:hypothetical protein
MVKLQQVPPAQKFEKAHIVKGPIPMMTFPEAIKQVIEGKVITKLEWGDENIYGALLAGRLKIHKDDNKFYDWILNDGDLTGTDFIVIS